jgi:NAD(P)H-hydrate epimerase
VNWEIVRAMGLPVEKAEKSVLARSDTDLIVDAIFGTGLSSPPRDWFAALADAINSARATGKKVLAIDIPSGLDCDTGRALGPCVRATMTVTFVAEKVGFAAAGAEEYLGQIVVGDIGCPRELVEMALRGD